MPAEKVLTDKAQDNYNHKAKGDPMEDAAVNNWDMFNGVADP